MTGTSHTQNRLGQAPDGMLAGKLLASGEVPSPGLPKGVWRDQFLETIIEAYRDALTPSDQCVLRFYASQTRPADWSAPGLGPICYVGQLNTAERLRLDRKSVYNAERHLEALGLIEKSSLANGHRRGPRGLRIESVPLGICFAPAIARYEEITEQVEIAQAMREALQAARYRVSGLRTKLRIRLRDAGFRDSVIDAMNAEFETLPSQIARISDFTRLEELEDAFQRMLDDLVDYIEAQQPVNNHDGELHQSGKFPHKGGFNSPYQYNTTTNPSHVPCMPEGTSRTDANASDDNISEPANAGIRLKNKPVSQPGPVNWTIAQISNAATDLFRSCLDIQSGSSGQVTSETIVDAASDIASMLGINHSAWADACTVMGRFDAALAVLVLDRNRNHPTNPVRSPGGALRAMTERARSGDLNIDASIFAILRRSDIDADRPN